METTQEQKKQKQANKSGRKKNENFLPYEEAKQFVRSECIGSRQQYENWFQQNKPKVVPRFPYRVYKDEWVSWNDFLGTNNEFRQKKKDYRDYNEAVLWVHKLKIDTMENWLDYCHNHELPLDIPTRPDIVYKNDWRSWKHWLGNSVEEKVEAQREAQKVALFYIINERDNVENILTFGVETQGLSALKERWEKEQFRLVKLFWYDQTKTQEIEKIISNLSTEYYGNSSVRIVPNVFELIWHLQKVLEVVT